MTNALQNEACFFHMVKGCSDYFADTQSLRLQPRESALLRCGNYAMHVSKTDTNTEFEFVAVHFFPEVLRKIYDKDLPSFLRDPAPNAQGVPAMSEVKNQLLLKYIDSLLFYFDNPELAHEDLLILKVKELILLLAQTNNAPRITEMLRSLFTPTTYSFRETMDAHMLSPLSTAELAELTHRAYRPSSGNS